MLTQPSPCLCTATRSYFVLRFGLSDTSSRTAVPGSSSSLHRPVFLTWTVSTAPFTPTWAIKRLGRSTKMPSAISLYFNLYSIFSTGFGSHTHPVYQDTVPRPSCRFHCCRVLPCSSRRAFLPLPIHSGAAVPAGLSGCCPTE